MAGKKKVVFKVDGRRVYKPYQCLACVPKSYYESPSAAVLHTMSVVHKGCRHLLLICNEEWCVLVVTPFQPDQKHVCLKLLVIEDDDSGDSEAESSRPSRGSKKRKAKKSAVETRGYYTR